MQPQKSPFWEEKKRVPLKFRALDSQLFYAFKMSLEVVKLEYECVLAKAALNLSIK